MNHPALQEDVCVREAEHRRVLVFVLQRQPHPEGGQNMATKDKNTKKSMEKKPAQKTLKEKRQAKKAKK
jgi:hypothetical protein